MAVSEEHKSGVRPSDLAARAGVSAGSPPFPFKPEAVRAPLGFGRLARRRHARPTGAERKADGVDAVDVAPEKLGIFDARPSRAVPTGILDAVARAEVGKRGLEGEGNKR